MNIETLLEKINLFDQMVIESGFARDVEEYLTTIAQPGVQGNLVALKGIADDLIESLEKIILNSQCKKNNALKAKKPAGGTAD